MARRSVHGTGQNPPQRRPTPPRRRLSRTRTRASQRARPPISGRRSPASETTRARAAGRRSLSAPTRRLRRRVRPGRSVRPPLAAAGRAAPRPHLRHVEEASFAHGHAHPCAERAREHRQHAADGSVRARESTETGEFESKGARRGDARTIGMRSVAELSRTRELVGELFEAKNRQLLLVETLEHRLRHHSMHSCSHERSGAGGRCEMSMCAFDSIQMRAAHGATAVSGRTFRWNGHALLIEVRTRTQAAPTACRLLPAKDHALRGASGSDALRATCAKPTRSDGRGHGTDARASRARSRQPIGRPGKSDG